MLVERSKVSEEGGWNSNPVWRAVIELGRSVVLVLERVCRSRIEIGTGLASSVVVDGEPWELKSNVNAG